MQSIFIQIKRAKSKEQNGGLLKKSLTERLGTFLLLDCFEIFIFS